MKPRVLLVGFRRDYPGEGLGKSSLVEITQNPALNALAGYLGSKDVECKMQEVFYIANKISREEEIISAIKEYQPTLIGFSVMDVDNETYNNFRSYLEKTPGLENTHFVAGGYSPTASPREYVKDNVMVVEGHGELPLELLIGNLENKTLSEETLSTIPRLWWGRGGIVKRSPLHQMRGEIEAEKHVRYDFDSYLLPQEGKNPTTGFPYYVKPAWYELPISEMEYMTISARRGCNNSCTFCLNPLMNKGKIVERDQTIIIDELKELADKGYNFVFFADEEFFQDPIYTNNLLTKIIENKIPEKIKFTSMVCVDSLVNKDGTVKEGAKESLKLFKKANFEELQFGVESGSQLLLNAMRKNQTTTSIQTAFKMTAEHGMTTAAMLILGHPNETLESLEETKKLIYAITPDRISTYYLSIFSRTPDYMKHKDVVAERLSDRDTSSPNLKNYFALEKQLEKHASNGKSPTPQQYLKAYRFNLLRDYYSSSAFFEKQKQLFDTRTKNYGDNVQKLLAGGAEWFKLLENDFSMPGFNTTISSYLQGAITEKDIHCRGPL